MVRGEGAARRAGEDKCRMYLVAREWFVPMLDISGMPNDAMIVIPSGQHVARYKYERGSARLQLHTEVGFV